MPLNGADRGILAARELWNQNGGPSLSAKN